MQVCVNLFYFFLIPEKKVILLSSCWAFTAVAVLEGQNYKKTKNLIELSAQNLIDCSLNQTNSNTNSSSFLCLFL